MSPMASNKKNQYALNNITKQNNLNIVLKNQGKDRNNDSTTIKKDNF